MGSPFYLTIMRYIILPLLLIINLSTLGQTEELNELINHWHINAAKGNFDAYFDVTNDDFVFLGTAPGERWIKEDFMSFCKPYFDRGAAWDFTSSNRTWIIKKKVAWFDEDLSTWMEGCRGSGIMVKEKGQWKLAYYNLTVLIENEKIQPFIELRKEPLPD